MLNLLEMGFVLFHQFDTDLYQSSIRYATCLPVDCTREDHFGKSRGSRSVNVSSPLLLCKSCRDCHRRNVACVLCTSSAPSTAIEQTCFNFIIRLKLPLGFRVARPSSNMSTVVKYEIARHAMLLLRLRGSLERRLDWNWFATKYPGRRHNSNNLTS